VLGPATESDHLLIINYVFDCISNKLTEILCHLVTVSRPPPGFTAVSEVHKKPLISPTGSAAPGQSNYVPAMPGSSQTLLPDVPMANTIVSNFIPQPTNVPIPPVMYDVPLLANASSLAAQSSVLQRLTLYENTLQQNN
jgi:hypothetical protein